MADQATETMTMQATPERCFEVVTDFEHYPEWAGFIRQVTVEKRAEEGRGRSVDERGGARGGGTSETLRDGWAGAGGGWGWVGGEGDMGGKVGGSCVGEPREDGGTDVLYHLEADLKVPLPG